MARIVLVALLTGSLLLTCQAALGGEEVAHHGEEVNPRGSMEDCLFCHDGRIARAVDYCTANCSIWSSHPVRRPYPPRGQESSYRPVAELQALGIVLVDGAVDCISCHDLRNPEKGHLVPDTEQVGLCVACHVNLR
ncbi:cytochrome c3 family protein [Geobacter sp.]|uniref:cytochrome c3 family protein n=1 Tax=Geobacter sp. TaxID=46610 RepID=UPI002629CC55|nr:cytochrome c3 family protein [Geobacter sp.]